MRFLKYFFDLNNLNNIGIGFFKIFEILSVTATSSPIERIFSIASILSAKQRSNIKFQTLNKKMFVYLNNKVLDFEF